MIFGILIFFVFISVAKIVLSFKKFKQPDNVKFLVLTTPREVEWWNCLLYLPKYGKWTQLVVDFVLYGVLYFDFTISRDDKIKNSETLIFSLVIFHAYEVLYFDVQPWIKTSVIYKNLDNADSQENSIQEFSKTSKVKFKPFRPKSHSIADGLKHNAQGLKNAHNRTSAFSHRVPDSGVSNQNSPEPLGSSEIPIINIRQASSSQVSSHSMFFHNHVENAKIRDQEEIIRKIDEKQHHIQRRLSIDQRDLFWKLETQRRKSLTSASARGFNEKSNFDERNRRNSDSKRTHSEEKSRRNSDDRPRRRRHSSTHRTSMSRSNSTRRDQLQLEDNKVKKHQKMLAKQQLNTESRKSDRNNSFSHVKDKRSTTERRDSVVLADYYSDEAYHAYNGKGAEEVTAMDQANRLRQAGLVESRTYTKEALKSGEDRNRRRSVVLSVGVRKNM